MHYNCSACHKPIGLIKGTFLCVHTGMMAHIVPTEPTRREPLRRSKSFESEDLSQRAKKRKKQKVVSMKWLEV